MTKLQTYLFPFFLFLMLLAQSFFIVDETEKVVKLKFGEIVQSDFEPGLGFKIPLVHSIKKFDDRILTINNDADLFLTAEKKNLVVDFFVKWRILDAAKFYRATQGFEGAGSARLENIIKDSLKSEFVKLTVQEAVSADRTEIMQAMFERVTDTAKELGVEVIDVRIVRLDLPDDVIGDAYERMRQERKRVATGLRSEGEEQAKIIRAKAERERTVILSSAYRDAEIVRGEADDIMVLSPDSEFFEYLGDSEQN